MPGFVYLLEREFFKNSMMGVSLDYKITELFLRYSILHSDILVSIEITSVVSWFSLTHFCNKLHS